MRDFKYIKGKSEDNVFTISFFDEFNDETVREFLDEFRWLEYLKPSAIKILINSEGGSVIRGMGMFSSIQNSTVKVIGCVEGLAASMGSVILAACDEIHMRDYARIMIHNPFSEFEEGESDATRNFREMLQEIYTSRWGIDKEKMQSIMDGDDGKDGTWLNSKKAVSLGIVDKKNVIKTTPQKKKDVEGKLSAINKSSELVEIYASIIKDEQPEKNSSPIFSQKETKTKNNTEKRNNMEDTIKGLASILSVETDKVIAKVSELSTVEARLEDLKKKEGILAGEVKAKDVKISGLTASLANTEAALTSANVELDAYKAKEVADKEAEQDKYFNDAVKSGKIKEGDVAGWKANAKAGVDFELIKSTINSIVVPKKLSISDEIKNTSAKDVIEDGGQKTDAEKVAEALEAERIKKLKAAGIDPETFKYKKLN